MFLKNKKCTSSCYQNKFPITIILVDFYKWKIGSMPLSLPRQTDQFFCWGYAVCLDFAKRINFFVEATQSVKILD